MPPPRSFSGGRYDPDTERETPPQRHGPAPLLTLVGLLTLGLFILNTVFWCVILYAVTLARLLMPVASGRRALGRALVWIGEAWIACNSLGLERTQPTKWEVSGLGGLDPRASYLVLANHQSWVDIPVLQRVFLGKIPFLRFFLKRELIWVPFLGVAWWALDFPFMKRHSRAYLEKNPERRGEDLETTRRACAKFRDIPVSIQNFVEGTRFTEEKKVRLSSPYRHLLPPKPGGVAFTIASMGESLRALLDVTIVYPGGKPTFWDLISRRVPRIVVEIREVPLPGAERGEVQSLLTRLWEEKDARIERLAEAPE